jgi:LysM repeat protein
VSSYTIPDVSPLISAPAFAEQPQALEAVPSTQLVTTHHKERVLPSTRKGEVAVKQRDTLWGLADIYLGDAYRWPELWKLNPHITDPNLILPGQKIKLPKEEKSGEVPVDVTPGNGQGNDQGIEKGNDQGNGETKPQSLLENDLAIAAAGFVGLQAQRMPNRNKQRLSGLPDGLFILDEFSNRLQPFYKPDHNGDTKSQVERLDTLGMDVVNMASSAEVDMKMTDENTPVISWESSFVSSPLDN